MKEIIKDIKTMEGLDCAVETVLNLNNGYLNNELAEVIHKKIDELKIYSGLIIGNGYDISNDVYYFLLLNDFGIDHCIIYNEVDYYKLKQSIHDIDTKLQVTIKGIGIIEQGNNTFRFNSTLNTCNYE